MSVGLRIKQLRAEKKISQKAFSEKIGVSQGYLSDVEADKTKASIDIPINIAKKLPEINLHWFLTGEGEMYAGEAPNVTYLNKKTGKPILISELSDTLEMVRIELDRAREEVRRAQEIMGF